MEKTLSIEAKRLLMYSNKDYEKVKQKLQKLGRSENRVSTVYNLIECIFQTSFLYKLFEFNSNLWNYHVSTILYVEYLD